MKKSMSIKKNIRWIAVLVVLLYLAASRINGAIYAANDEEAVNQVIENFQNAYSSKNIVELQNQFHHRAIVGIQFENQTQPSIASVNDWIKETRGIFESRTWISDKLTNRRIEVYRDTMATVVCDYEYKDPVSHQVGIDIFTLMKVRGEWKIVSLIFSGEYAN